MTLGHLSSLLAKCVNRVIALTALFKSEIQAGLMKVIIISWIIGLSCSRVYRQAGRCYAMLHGGSPTVETDAENLRLG